MRTKTNRVLEIQNRNANYITADVITLRSLPVVDVTKSTNAGHCADCKLTTFSTLDKSLQPLFHTSEMCMQMKVCSRMVIYDTQLSK